MMYGTNGDIEMSFSNKDTINLDLPGSRCYRKYTYIQIILTLGTRFTRLGNSVPRNKDLSNGDLGWFSFLIASKNGRVKQLTKIIQIRGIFQTGSRIYVIFIIIQ